LDDETDGAGKKRPRDQRTPKTEIGRECVSEIGADDEEAAMRHVDHGVQAQNERKSERHQRVEHALDQPVERIEKQQLHRRPSRPLFFGGPDLSHTAPPSCKGGAALAGAQYRTSEITPGSRACTRYPSARSCRRRRCPRL